MRGAFCARAWFAWFFHAVLRLPGRYFCSTSRPISVSTNAIYEHQALFQVFPSDQTLGILFDRDIQYVQLVFGSTTIGQLTLTASDQNLIQVGQTSATSNFLPGGANPEGSISFGGTAFRSLTLRFASSDQTGTFAIDNVTDVPEPTSILLFGLGALTLGSACKLRSRSYATRGPAR